MPLFDGGTLHAQKAAEVNLSVTRAAYQEGTG
jgi:hypothetical protein